jgi:predicted MFS family arabinose efflux permease
LIGVADAVFPPAIAAISLGIAGPNGFVRRVGCNEAFNHVGNVAAALLAGIAGWAINLGVVLWLTALMAALSIGAVLNIDGKAIDHKMARGAAENRQDLPLNLFELFACKPLLIFTAAITLFHFANAAMLPLLGQKLAQSHPSAASLVIASCIITAQIIMVPMAILVGHKTDGWGRKPIFLAGFAVLPIRGFLYTLSQDPYYLVSIQILDGIGVGIFGALFYIVVADLTEGTGHYNLALGVTSTCWGLGAGPEPFDSRLYRRSCGLYIIRHFCVLPGSH